MRLQVGRPAGAHMHGPTTVSSTPGPGPGVMRRRSGVRGQSESKQTETDGSRGVASDSWPDTTGDVQIGKISNQCYVHVQSCKSYGTPAPEDTNSRAIEGRSISSARRSSPVRQAREDLSDAIADIQAAASGLRRGSPEPHRTPSVPNRSPANLQFQSRQPLRGEVQIGLTGSANSSLPDWTTPRVLPFTARSMKETNQGFNQKGAVHNSIPAAGHQQVQSALLSDQPSAEAALMDKIFSSIDDVRFAMQHDIEQRKAQDENCTSAVAQLTRTMTEHQKAVASGGIFIANQESSPASDAEKVLFEIKSLMANEMRAFAEALPAACGVLRDEAQKEINRLKSFGDNILSTLTKLTEEALPASFKLLKGEVQKAMLELKSVAPNHNQAASHLQKLDISVASTEKEIAQLKECIDGHSQRFADIDIEFDALQVERGTLVESHKSQRSRIDRLEHQDSTQLHNHTNGFPPEEAKVDASTLTHMSRLSAIESKVESALDFVAAWTEIAPSMHEMGTACLKVKEVTVRLDEIKEVQAMCQAQIASCRSILSKDIDTTRQGIDSLRKDIEWEASARESLASRLEFSIDAVTKDVSKLQKRVASLHQLIMHGPGSSQAQAVS